MKERELQEYLLFNYPQEDEKCEWKEFRNLKNMFSGNEGNDVVSYVCAISNMNGGNLIIGVEDKTLNIVGTDYSQLKFNGQTATKESATFKLTEHCTNLSREGLNIIEYITDDSHKKVWVIQIPKHFPRQPVYAYKKAWQRIKDSLVPMKKERMDAILNESIAGKDWSAEIIPHATLQDLDPKI